MQEIRSSNSPVVTGICDPNKSRHNIIAIFSLVSACFRFTEISYFPNFSSNENVRKQHLSANVYSCVNMKLSYMIAGVKTKFSVSHCYENKRFFAGV